MDSAKSGSSHPLEVKKSAVLRTLKDYELYKHEAAGARSRLESLKASADEHDVKKAKEVADEAAAVLADTKKRLTDFANDLDVYLTESVVPMLNSGRVPAMCKGMVADAQRALADLAARFPELGFEPSSSAA